MQEILNIAAYKFVAIDDSPVLREDLRARAQALGLMGTILLAPEGINLFLAGPTDGVRAFLAHLRADARFADLEAKESWSAAQPFRRMLVKLKREIIRMDHPAIQPAAGRAPGVDAPTLKRCSTRAMTTRAGRSPCSTRAMPSKSITAASKAPSTGASASSPSSRPPSRRIARSSRARRS